MNKTIIDIFAEQANLVGEEILRYVQLPNDERDEANEAQMRRLRAITGSLNAKLGAVSPLMVFPQMPPAPPPPSAED